MQNLNIRMVLQRQEAMHLLHRDTCMNMEPHLNILQRLQ